MKNNLKSIVAIIMAVAVLGTTLGMPSVTAKSAINQNNNPTEYETIEDLISEIEGEISELEGLGEVIEEAVLVEYAKQELTQLKLDVEELNIPQGAKNSLFVKLDAALKKNNQALEFIQEGKEKQANNILKAINNVLDAFISELKAQSGKKISEEDAVSLVQRTQTIIEIIKEKNIKKALEELELVEKPEILVEIDQNIEEIQEIITELQAMGLTVEFVEEDGVYMIVVSGSPIVWKVVILPLAKAALSVAGTIILTEYKLGKTLAVECKIGLYAFSLAFSGAMTALGFQLLLAKVGLGIVLPATAEIIIGAAFSEILSEMVKIVPFCILPLPWITCSTCPEPPEVSIVGNKICMGMAGKNEGDTQGISIHGASALLPQSKKYQITFDFDLYTWDSYNALGTPNPPYYGGTGYWDSFSISISQNPYWTLGLTDPVTEMNLPGLGFLWGGTSYGDGFIESNSGIQTIEIIGDPNTPNYLNVVLDTAILPESNHAYPSWGCIEVTVIPK